MARSSYSHKFSADRPISNENDDQFQRYGFAKRIAKIIAERKSNECIVIGIYGSWGEGKTSVLNFIDTELSKQSSTITLKFNPWRFNDENTLLLQFFKILSAKLHSTLKHSYEQIGELLKKYGEILSFNIPVIGNLGKSVQTVGEALDNVDIETLKARIEEALIKSNHKIVVFIDDIDRLDKQEIYSILRLVKLNAEFSNLIYVLSFDEQMVSHAIGDRYGDGTVVSGQSFLEKIVQIPLKLPVAQPEALSKFCYKLIDEAYHSNKLKLPESELRRFGHNFTNHVLTRLTTPRLAVRYGNAISFSIPLLKGEINMVDLLLIEAIKIFYPSFYEFIKYNPEYFIGSYSNIYSSSRDEDKKNQFKDHFEKLSKDLTKKQKFSIQELLQNLFPVLEEVFHNYNYSDRTSKNWQKNKNIASSYYFNRAFSYSVIKGEISDIDFDEFLSNITSSTVTHNANKIKRLVKISTPETFLRKIRTWEEDLPWQINMGLAKAICLVSEIFPKNEDRFQMSFEHPNGQAGIFIRQILKNHNNQAEKIDFAIELISETKNFDFVYTIYTWIRPDPLKQDNIFSLDEFSVVNRAFINRAIKESNGMTLFEKFPKSVLYIFDAWKTINEQEFKAYITNILDTHPEKVELLIQAYAPTASSTSHPRPYKGNIDDRAYNYLISIIDKELINKAINNHFTIEELNREPVQLGDDMEKNVSTMNMVRQFIHWYKNPPTINSNF